MARTADPSWEGFPKWIRTQMTNVSLGATALAEALNDENITPSTISKWRSGSQHPQLRLLPRIARALKADPLEVALELGVLPSEYGGQRQIETTLRLAELQSELLAEQALRRTSDIRHGLIELLEAVNRSGRWALGIHAAFEGALDPPIHIADRLAFRRIDGARGLRSQVLAEFGDQIRKLHASSSEMESWPEIPGDPSPLIRFSIPVYTRPDQPHRSYPYPRCASVIVLSTTIKSWSPVFSKRLAVRLQYGLTSSQDLAATAMSLAIDDTAAAERGQLGYLLIRNPPPRYVAYHFEATHIRHSRTLEALSMNPLEGVRIIWLDESDRVLEHAARYRSSDHRDAVGDLAAAREHRDEMRRVVAELGEKALVVPVDLPERFSPSSTPAEMRDARIASIIEAADSAHDRLRLSGWLEGDA